MNSSTKILIVALVLAILANPFTGWICYSKGETKGYSKASKDRATQTYAAREQNVENIFNYASTKTFALLSWGRFHLFSIDGAVTKPEVTQKIVKEEEPKEAKK